MPLRILKLSPKINMEEKYNSFNQITEKNIEMEPSTRFYERPALDIKQVSLTYPNRMGSPRDEIVH